MSTKKDGKTNKAQSIFDASDQYADSGMRDKQENKQDWEHFYMKAVHPHTFQQENRFFK